MNRVIRTSATLSLLLVLVFALSVGAGAELFRSLLDSELSGALGTFSLDSTVYRDLVGSNYEYTYEYALTFVSYGAGEDLAEGFRLGNPSKVPIFNMSNTGDFGNFADGVYDPISWSNGFMEEGDTVVFSFKSLYRPFEDPITVNCFVVDGAKTATGQTLGMAAMIPEPSAFATLGLGILGMVPMLRRRK